MVEGDSEGWNFGSKGWWVGWGMSNIRFPLASVLLRGALIRTWRVNHRRAAEIEKSMVNTIEKKTIDVLAGKFEKISILVIIEGWE